MDNIKVLIDEKTLKQRIKDIAKEIEKDYKDKEINLICILKGSIFFTCELAKNINKNVKIDFLRIASYDGTDSNKIKLVADLLPSIKDKDIIVIEDIIDTGKTLNYLIPYLKKSNPSSIKVCTLLDKPSRRIVDFKADYVGFEVEDKFIVGYGLDYNQNYRNLPFIGYIEKND